MIAYNYKFASKNDRIGNQTLSGVKNERVNNHRRPISGFRQSRIRLKRSRSSSVVSSKVFAIGSDFQYFCSLILLQLSSLIFYNKKIILKLQLFTSSVVLPQVFAICSDFFDSLDYEYHLKLRNLFKASKFAQFILRTNRRT